MKLSLAYFTNRGDPRFEWFVDSLYNQIPDGAEIDLIFIDLRLDYDSSRRDYLARIMDGRMPYRHLPPKPNPWQGKHRKTLADFFAASNARNTAFIHAESSYIVCVDDVSILMPGYVDRILRAATKEHTVLGAYKKCTEMEVKNGCLLSFGKESIDSRWDWAAQTVEASQKHAEAWRVERAKKPYDKSVEETYKEALENLQHDPNFVKAPSSILYGCSFGLPLDLALEVNGFDESYDGMGFEDPDFGERVFRVNKDMYYDRRMLTIESEEYHNQPEFNVIKRLKLSKSGEPLDWYLLNRLKNETERTLPLAEWSNLREIRKKKDFSNTTYPDTDWVDNQPYREMTTIERAGDQLIAEKILRSGEKDAIQWEHHKDL